MKESEALEYQKALEQEAKEKGQWVTVTLENRPGLKRIIVEVSILITE